jgi:hypothetical protein
MVEHDLDAPARLLWWPTTPKSIGEWETAQTYGSLKRAITEAVTNPLTDQMPWILTEAGGTLKPSDIAALWRAMNPARSN